MTTVSGLYRGIVTHRRLRPRTHELRYRAFWLLLDLDEIDGLAARLRLFSRGGFGLLAFHEADHGEPGSTQPLRAQLEARLAAAGVRFDGGPIRLLTLPRVLGYVFNPLSVYYCHQRDGALAAVVYEVNNTFGERHSYVIPVAAADAAGGRIRQRCGKALYVSPFLDMDMAYGFRGAAPGETLTLAIEAADATGPVLQATLAARRQELTDGAIVTTALRLPFAGLRVIVAIHWEALKLWAKGVPLVPRTRKTTPA